MKSTITVLSQWPGQSRPWEVNTTGAGTDPDHGHLRRQDWASDLGHNRPETASSTGADADQGHLRRQD